MPPSVSDADKYKKAKTLRLVEINRIKETLDIAKSAKQDDSLRPVFIQRLDSGQHVVSLPFKTEIEPIFENTKLSALRRFLSLEKRLKSNPTLYNDYRKIIQDYIDSDHLALATSCDQNEYFIPHHCVFNPNSITSPVRIVFDASCKDSNNLSLNNCLMTGPKLQKDIASVLLNFRIFSIAITADIKAIYRQIRIDPKYYKFQKILWRFPDEEPIREYNSKTVTFGVSSSPYLALRTIIQLANDEKHNYKSAANILLSNNIFVDDICTGCNSIDDAVILQRDLTNLLKKEGFELKKWASNNHEFLKHIDSDLLHTKCVSFDSEPIPTLKILGLQWNPNEDNFSYVVTPSEKPCTKRNILSDIARVYDPLGFLTPVTLFSRLLIQKLWSLNLDWDDVPPAHILKRWNDYNSQLSELSALRIPRCIFSETYEYVDLCGFCDGSQHAYAACVYVRIVSQNRISTILLAAKSKVAPLKTQSIPRLELCGALLLTRLIHFVIKSLATTLTFKNIFTFTDSLNVLHWLHASPHRFKPFIANRIAIIQELPNSIWLHVATENNAADPASRGLLPLDFVKCSSWWTGPDFIKLPTTTFYDNFCKFSPDFPINESDKEERKIALITVNQFDIFEQLLEKYSSLSKIQRILGYVNRFIFNLRNPNSRNTSYFSARDLNNALLLLVKHVQYKYFRSDLENFLSKKLMSKPFCKLAAFVDDLGFFRVGGKLKNSLLNYEKKYPLILPSNCRLTYLLLEYTHKCNLHPGVQTTQFLLSQHYWILSTRRAVKRVLSKCLTCFRVNPPTLQPLMGNLPASRISKIKPFSVVGIDFGGPFFITATRIRGVKVIKAYICIFVCFATKAIHIELASDLSANCFLCALRRFIAQRGRCSKIVSDNATNFSGANKYLLNIFKTAAAEEKIEWRFNPPSASHFGGLYEAGIKSVKSHLARVIGDQRLIYEEFNTILVQIEALLNSRPLSPQSSDPNDFLVLTPGHFLTLEPLTCLPDPDMSNLKINNLDRYQLLLRLHQDFWTRWHSEYLNTLQQRAKWLTPGQPLNEGDLVLIKSENIPPMTWKIARVTKLFPGTDNIDSHVSSSESDPFGGDDEDLDPDFELERAPRKTRRLDVQEPLYDSSSSSVEQKKTKKNA
ncbi:uncharacterized protein LOC115880184 [Sitophilus oryzae]|uniref:Uncharacterized protein LOC115880184 n=1 Tax=Sitophilus oryzae TaxID=7048 RepID=A0A6J2XQ32_SITOR|nr:uncharacterized protein LOC115880184 [Sitophilus oryzae]